MKRVLLKSVFLISLIGFFSAGFFFAVQKGLFRLQSFSIQTLGSQVALYKIIAPDLEKSLVVYKGTQLWNLDIHKIELGLLQIPWIKNIKIARRLPDQLQLEIEPKRILAAMLSSRGEFYPLLEDGSVLHAFPENFKPDLPLLTQSVFFKNLELREKVVHVLRELPNEGSLSHQNIAEVFMIKNDMWLRLIPEGISVKLGEEQLHLRTARVAKVMEYLDQHELRGRVIDADYTKKVVVRLRNDR